MSRLPLILTGVLVAGAALLNVNAQAAEPPKPEPVYHLDLSALNKLDLTKPAEARKAWDTLHTVASIQGLVNRDSPTLFIQLMAGTDDFWWDTCGGDKQWLSGRPVIELRDVEEAVKTFAPKFKGAVMYDSQVTATSSLASTIAGVEDRLVVRNDPSPDSVCAALIKMPEFPKDVVRLYKPDGSPMFTGQGKIPDIDIDSTGSAKNDAYLWAKARYLDPGKCSREFLAYYLDSYWLSNPNSAAQGPNQGISNTTLENHDYYISKRAFFFDLGMWPEESPIDDPHQNPGTDVTTLKAILKTMQSLNPNHIYTIGGFLAWSWKYCGRIDNGAWPGSGGTHHPVHSEWKYAQIISAYNGMMDADAMGGMANASFYQHFPLKDHYPQQKKPTLDDLKARGLVLADGTVKKGNYVALYLGDYDAASWFNQFSHEYYADPMRGKVICNWGFDPLLDLRAPHAVDFVRTHASATDWFISGDSGMGYLNPGMLTAPREDPSVPDGWDAWTKQNEAYFKRYDLTIAGFVIEGNGPFIGERGLDSFARFAPDGMMLLSTSKTFDLVGLHKGSFPYIRHQVDIDGTPQVAAKQLWTIINGAKSHYNGGPEFLCARTVIKTPTWISQTMEAAKLEPGGDQLTFLDSYSFFLLLKTQLQHEEQAKGVDAGKSAVSSQ